MKLKRSWAAVALMLLALGCGAGASQFEGRSAWTLANDRVRVTMLEGGGHIAELALLGADGSTSQNPLWIPPWRSIEPWDYNASSHASDYGAAPRARTLASIMGHNLCFPFWGIPSQAEEKAGSTSHAEAGVTRWENVAQNETRLTARAKLESSRAVFSRSLRVVDGQPAVYFEETAENLVAWDRPIGWVQHVSFGPPFLSAAHTVFDASATVGSLPWDEEMIALEWGAPKDETLDFRRAPEGPKVNRVGYFLLDPKREIEFVSALNLESKLLVVYIFRREDFPWLVVWDENRNQTQPPWNGRGQARGMEFGNTVISGTAQSYLAEPTRHGVQTFGWLEADAKKTARYFVLLAEAPASFEGVDNVVLDGSTVLISGRGTSEKLKIPYQPLYFDLAELREAE